MNTPTAIAVGEVAALIGFALLAALSDERAERPQQRSEGTRRVEHETRRVNAAARRAVERRDAQLFSTRLLAPETRRRVESTMRMSCERFYRRRARASGRLRIDRRRLYVRVAIVDARTTAGTSGVLIFLRDGRRGWLFLRRLVVSANLSPGRRGEQPEGLSVS